MSTLITLTRQQVTMARWVADHSPDEVATEVPVQIAGPDGNAVILRFERSPVDRRWVLVTPVIITDEDTESGRSLQ